MKRELGPFELNRVTGGDCLDLIRQLPDDTVDIVITSPPYWGQRASNGTGIEEDPRTYLEFLTQVFLLVYPKLKQRGLLWINLGDAYNTPVNWQATDSRYSSLGPDQSGLSPENSAYVKPRSKRRAYIDGNVAWLRYGNLLALPYRLILGLCDNGYLFRGEVIWRKLNPMPEGKCRRPHRQHESIYLLTKVEDHYFRIAPPVRSIWEFPNEKIEGTPHFSRFPEELPRRCIESYGAQGDDVIVLDPFSGSGTTGIAARKLGCSYIGFEIDPIHVRASNDRLVYTERDFQPLFSAYESVSTR
jgi:DNA modification methylase